jgi:hypothetical protein
MKTKQKNMKKTLIIAAVVAFGLATLGIAVGPVETVKLVPLGLTLYVFSKLTDK